jgi:hypothetical protein
MPEDKKIANKSQDVINKDDDKKYKPIDYSEEEVNYRSFVLTRLEDARDQMTMKWTELDGMDVFTWYEKNKKTAISYNKPKESIEDTEIVTSTTEEKNNSLLNTILNQNLEPNITAYDKNDMVVNELGTAMEKAVKKAKKLDNYDGKRRYHYKELIDQGTAYSEIVDMEKFDVIKDIDKTTFSGSLDKVKWNTKYERCVVIEDNLIPQNKVFLGNIRCPYIEKQPYIAIVDYIPYSEAKRIYGKYQKWENVTRKMVEMNETLNTTEGYTYSNWRLFNTNSELVERIRYEDKNANEYNLYLNGVQMLKPGFPLSVISGDGEYTVTKGDALPISDNFALSKSWSSKTKIAQAVLDEFVRLFILKTQKSLNPPMFNNSGQVLTKKIFLPGRITAGVNGELLKEVGNNPGITNSEVSMFQMVKGIIDEITVSSQFQALEQKAKTATQSIQDRNQNLLKIGIIILGIIEWERQKTARYVASILKAWTLPIDDKIDNARKKLIDIYKKFTIEDDVNGETGITEVEFTEEQMPSSEYVRYEQEAKKKKYGKPYKKFYLNAKLLKQNKYIWHYEIVPTEKDSSELKKMIFQEMLMGAIQIFGPQAVNFEALKPRYAQVYDEDKDVLFVNTMNSGLADIAQMVEGGATAGANGQAPSPNQETGSSKLSSEATSGIKNQNLKPSLNTLEGQTV